MTGLKDAENFLSNVAPSIAARVGINSIIFWSFEFLRFTCNIVDCSPGVLRRRASTRILVYRSRHLGF